MSTLVGLLMCLRRLSTLSVAFAPLVTTAALKFRNSQTLSFVSNVD